MAESNLITGNTTNSTEEPTFIELMISNLQADMLGLPKDLNYEFKDYGNDETQLRITYTVNGRGKKHLFENTSSDYVEFASLLNDLTVTHLDDDKLLDENSNNNNAVNYLLNNIDYLQSEDTNDDEHATPGVEDNIINAIKFNDLIKIEPEKQKNKINKRFKKPKKFLVNLEKKQEIDELTKLPKDAPKHSKQFQKILNDNMKLDPSRIYYSERDYIVANVDGQLDTYDQINQYIADLVFTVYNENYRESIVYINSSVIRIGISTITTIVLAAGPIQLDWESLNGQIIEMTMPDGYIETKPAGRLVWNVANHVADDLYFEPRKISANKLLPSNQTEVPNQILIKYVGSTPMQKMIKTVARYVNIKKMLKRAGFQRCFKKMNVHVGCVIYKKLGFIALTDKYVVIHVSEPGGLLGGMKKVKGSFMGTIDDQRLPINKDEFRPRYASWDILPENNRNKDMTSIEVWGKNRQSEGELIVSLHVPNGTTYAKYFQSSNLQIRNLVGPLDYQLPFGCAIVYPLYQEAFNGINVDLSINGISGQGNIVNVNPFTARHYWLWESSKTMSKHKIPFAMRTDLVDNASKFMTNRTLEARTTRGASQLLLASNNYAGSLGFEFDPLPYMINLAQYHLIHNITRDKQAIIEAVGTSVNMWSKQAFQSYPFVVNRGGAATSALAGLNWWFKWGTSDDLTPDQSYPAIFVRSFAYSGVQDIIQAAMAIRPDLDGYYILDVSSLSQSQISTMLNMLTTTGYSGAFQTDMVRDYLIPNAFNEVWAPVISKLQEKGGGFLKNRLLVLVSEALAYSSTIPSFGAAPGVIAGQAIPHSTSVVTNFFGWQLLAFLPVDLRFVQDLGFGETFNAAMETIQAMCVVSRPAMLKSTVTNSNWTSDWDEHLGTTIGNSNVVFNCDSKVTNAGNVSDDSDYLFGKHDWAALQAIMAKGATPSGIRVNVEPKWNLRKEPAKMRRFMELARWNMMWVRSGQAVFSTLKYHSQWNLFDGDLARTIFSDNFPKWLDETGRYFVKNKWKIQLLNTTGEKRFATSDIIVDHYMTKNHQMNTWADEFTCFDICDPMNFMYCMGMNIENLNSIANFKYFLDIVNLRFNDNKSTIIPLFPKITGGMNDFSNDVDIRDVIYAYEINVGFAAITRYLDDTVGYTLVRDDNTFHNIVAFGQGTVADTFEILAVPANGNIKYMTHNLNGLYPVGIGTFAQYGIRGIGGIPMPTVGQMTRNSRYKKGKIFYNNIIRDKNALSLEPIKLFDNKDFLEESISIDKDGEKDTSGISGSDN